MSLKEKIIIETLKLFSLNGFSSTSLHDILNASNSSKGGFYNHFASKEDLFFQVLEKARKIWREKNLEGLNEIASPIGKVDKLLRNFRDRYLKDSENFPGGCIFITLSVELNDQRPHLNKEISKGFDGLKAMIKRLLNQGKEEGELIENCSIDDMTEVIFSGIIGASVIFGMDKSADSLDLVIKSVINYLAEKKK